MWVVNISFIDVLMREDGEFSATGGTGTKESQAKHNRGLAVSNPITPEEGEVYSLISLKGS